MSTRAHSGAVCTDAVFGLALARAEADLRGGQEAIWPVNAYSDADELRALLEAAQDAGFIGALFPGAALSIRPSSISQPIPLLTVDLTSARTLLGPELRLGERDGEDPIEFTLRLLEEAVGRANNVVLAAGLERSGRQLLDHPDP